MVLPIRLLVIMPWIAAVLFPGTLQAATEGAGLYQQHCALCHGAEGQGVPGVFPPLAGSDFLVRERTLSMKAVMEGLVGEVTVNGQKYHGIMPPVLLGDADLARVLNHVFSSWGNTVAKTTVQEVAAVRAQTKFPSEQALRRAMTISSLPKAPEGWEWKVGVDLHFSPVRLAAHPDGEGVLVLTQTGDVWDWRPGGGALSLALQGGNDGNGSTLGMTVDGEGRLYLTSNWKNEHVNPVRCDVTIFRTKAWSKKGGWSKPEPWFETSYPYGIGPFNHGVSCIAQGPDGMIYVTSGSRTDGGEKGTNPAYAQSGESSITACIWRLDPQQSPPKLEIYARGLRNTFGFCWDDTGRMIGTENGPDADPPEELNVIEQGKHYGFPFQFADWTKKPYPHTPDIPQGVLITKPLRAVKPGGGGLSTFEPHSCPSGIVWLGEDWPKPLGGSFLAARFGNLLKLDTDVGFDVLQLRPDFGAGTVAVSQLAGPLGRPIDVLKLSGHRLVVAEYCRGNSLQAGLGTPGRLLMLVPVSRAANQPR